ncbi:hypothetical protein CSA08_03390 [Candidatus Gracilibacteria bacterium]|nr:MAG: hypothetical protein CSA08_03390 [Candidatus Gracilibacteria bacterium]
MVDILIIGAGAAGLFLTIQLPQSLSKLILEKNPSPGTKVLLSGGERANVSNMNIEPELDYFGQNKKSLKSIFSRYTNWDIINFFEESGIEIVEEDRGRLILKSGDSRELLNLLLDKSKKNNTKLRCNSGVKEIVKHKDFYEVILISGEKIKSKNVVFSCGGKSFFQVGTTGDGYDFANKLGIKVISPHRGLCALISKKDFSFLSGSSINLGMTIFDKNREVYKEAGPMLFTHFGISGPIIFNASVALGEYLNAKNIETEQDKIKYILENISVNLNINKENATKKIYGFFKTEIDNEKPIEFGLQDWRTWKEAKITGGGIDINELDKYMQVKKSLGLFFIGEVVDITGKTGGYNLQWAWSSAYACSEYFNK